MDLVRLGLERGRTAVEALELMVNLLEEHGQGGVGEEATGDAYFSSFLICDPTGAWILETSDRTWAAKPVGRRGARGGSISNRLTLTTEWTRASRDVPPGANFQRWRDQDYPTPHADQRLAATSAVACADPAPGPRELAAVLRHHGGRPWGAPARDGWDADAVDPLPPPRPRRDGTGISVCMHLRNWEATTGAMVASLPRDPDRPARAWALLGNPCVGVFVPVVVAAGTVAPVPRLLDDPRTWARFDVLKGRVEAAADRTAVRLADGEGRDGADDRAALAEVRAVLGPLEADLWDEADELAGRGPVTAGSTAVGAWEAFAAACDARLDAALAALGCP